MFNTMTVTKALGAICASALVFLFATWASDALYHTGPAEGHGEEEMAQAYTIDTGATEVADGATTEGPAFDVVLASADPAAGEKVFGKCKACHKVDGSNGTGPHLNGVVNRARGSVEGFGYSEAMLSVKDAWSPENMNGFLTSPKAYMPGTKMAFAGLGKVEDRANVIAYLATMQ